MKKKLNNKKLFDNEFHVVENAKNTFLLPAAIIVLALIMGFIFLGVKGKFLNIGMDFTGGYRMTVTIGSSLTKDTTKKYADKAIGIIEGFTDEETGESYGIKVDNYRRQGSGANAGLSFMFFSVADTESQMLEIANKLEDELGKKMFFTEPDLNTFNVDGKTVTVEYPDFDLIGDYPKNIKDKVNTIEGKTFEVVEAKQDPDKSNRLILTFKDNVVADDYAAIKGVLEILEDGRVENGGFTGGTITDENLIQSMLAVVIALVLMFIYIIIRFEFLSGIASIICLIHDVLMMFCFMTIFHIEIGSTFIAALITILGYSINNSIIIFDRVRENVKMLANKRVDGKLVKPAFIANKSVKDTIWRTINTSVTTLIMILMVAIIGVSIRVFAFPLIIGILCGTYSSVFLAPAIWANLKRVFPGKDKLRLKKDSKGGRKRNTATEKLEV